MKKLTGGKIKQYIEKFRAVLKCRRGTTLVELIITFALIGLFVAGTCQMIAASVRTYHQIRGANQAHQVADTLMDKITGEIEGAQVGVPYDADSDGITLHIFEAGDKIELYDRTGSHIYITVNEAKELLIYYYPVKSQSETSSGSENRYEAVNWTYDEAFYMGFKIQSLKFSQADTTLYPENIIKVDMTLQRADGERAVETTRYVECYNFITAQDFDKIKDDSSGETPPPDVPDEPDKPDKDGEGSIIIDPDDNIDFVTNDVTYRELREEAREDKDKKILIPKGIYEEHGQYYIIPVDTQRTFYDLPGNLNAYWTQVRGENLCFKVNADKLYTEADIVTPSQQSHWTNWKDGKSPEMGSIYFYKGRYYVCIEPAGGYAPVDPVNSSNWYDITEFVKKLE